MSSGEMEHQVIETPQTHTLRVAVFDFHSGELLSRHGESPLFHDTQPIDERGFTGISHEQRATNVTRRHGMGNLALKTVGGRISILEDEDQRHDGYVVRTSEAIPYTFYRGAMYTGLALRRRALDEVYDEVHNVLDDDTNRRLDPVDAMILDRASVLFDELSDYKR